QRRGSRRGFYFWIFGTRLASGAFGGLSRLIGERKKLQQRALDRHLAGGRSDLGAEQVSDIEHVDDTLAEGGDVGGGDVEVELGQRRGQLIQQSGPIKAGHLDDGVAIGPVIVDRHLGLERKGLQRRLGA